MYQEPGTSQCNVLHQGKVDTLLLVHLDAMLCYARSGVETNFSHTALRIQEKVTFYRRGF